MWTFFITGRCAFSGSRPKRMLRIVHHLRLPPALPTTTTVSASKTFTPPRQNTTWFDSSVSIALSTIRIWIIPSGRYFYKAIMEDSLKPAPIQLGGLVKVIANEQ
ncbi:uncharacterized protein LOC134288146 [Aedes albopictus]|uniref:Secreted protein n=1 Tax=Aedes albopictus TaxID=7160 RepID=A0ABM1ZKB5_AEDAL